MLRKRDPVGIELHSHKTDHCAELLLKASYRQSRARVAEPPEIIMVLMCTEVSADPDRDILPPSIHLGSPSMGRAGWRLQATRSTNGHLRWFFSLAEGDEQHASAQALVPVPLGRTPWAMRLSTSNGRRPGTYMLTCGRVWPYTCVSRNRSSELKVGIYGTSQYMLTAI